MKFVATSIYSSITMLEGIVHCFLKEVGNFTGHIFQLVRV